MNAVEPSSGGVCQVCGEALGERPLRTCLHCATPHHEECWSYVGGCTTYGCAGRPAQPSVPVPGEVGPPVISCPPVGERRRFDLVTPFEDLAMNPSIATILLLLAGASGLGGVAVARYVLETGRWQPAAVPLGLCALVFMLVFAFAGAVGEIDCTYVVDAERQELRYSRTILGRTREWRVCALDAIAVVAVDGARRCRDLFRPSWEYSVVFVTGRGRAIRVSDWFTQLVIVNNAAVSHARELGVAMRRCSPGEREVVVVRDAAGRVQVEHRPWAMLHGWWRTTLSITYAMTLAVPFLALTFPYGLAGLGAAALQLIAMCAVLGRAPGGAPLLHLAWFFVVLPVLLAGGSTLALGSWFLGLVLLGLIIR